METEVAGGGSVRRRLWTADEKRRIVEQTLSSDSSVAMVARQHGVNANQVFYWRKLYRAGQLGKNEQPEGMRLLPVSVSDDEPSQSAAKQDPQTTSGVSINIEIPGRALVSVEGLWFRQSRPHQLGKLLHSASEQPGTGSCCGKPQQRSGHSESGGTEKCGCSQVAAKRQEQ